MTKPRSTEITTDDPTAEKPVAITPETAVKAEREPPSLEELVDEVGREMAEKQRQAAQESSSEAQALTDGAANIEGAAKDKGDKLTAAETLKNDHIKLENEANQATEATELLRAGIPKTDKDPMVTMTPAETRMTYNKLTAGAEKIGKIIDKLALQLEAENDPRERQVLELKIDLCKKELRETHECLGILMAAIAKGQRETPPPLPKAAAEHFKKVDRFHQETSLVHEQTMQELVQLREKAATPEEKREVEALIDDQRLLGERLEKMKQETDLGKEKQKIADKLNRLGAESGAASDTRLWEIAAETAALNQDLAQIVAAQAEVKAWLAQPENIPSKRSAVEKGAEPPTELQKVEERTRQLEAEYDGASEERKKEIDAEIKALDQKALQLEEAEAKAGKAAPEEKEAGPTPKELEMQRAGAELAKLEAQLNREFGGLGALKLISGEQRKAKEKLLNDIKEKAVEYDRFRAEVVGDNVDKIISEGGRQEAAKFKEIAEAKRFDQKLIGRLKDGYKKLGDLNLLALTQKIGGKRLEAWTPQNKLAKTAAAVGRFVGRTMSVRSAISYGLLGAGMISGATLSVGIATMAARRLMSGAGAAFGSYDVMKMAHERKEENVSDKQLVKMDKVELIARLEGLEAKALIAGKKPEEKEAFLKNNENYQKLKGRLDEIMKETPVEAADAEKAGAEAVENKSQTLLEQVNAKFEEMQQKSAQHKKVMAGLALAVGLTIGSGAMAEAMRETGVSDAIGRGFRSTKEFLGFKGDAAAAAATVDQHHPAAAETAQHVEALRPPTLAEKYKDIWQEATEQRGDGPTQTMERIIKAHKEAWHYDPAHDGDVNSWAKRMATMGARENNLLSAHSEMRFPKFDPENPQHLLIEPEVGADGEMHVKLVSNPELKMVVFEHPAVIAPEHGWKAGVTWSENGIPQHVKITVDQAPDPAAASRYLLEHNPGFKNLASSRSLESLLKGMEGGNQHNYGPIVGKIYEEQRVLDRLERLGYGHSPAAAELHKSIEQKLGIVARASSGEPVRFETPQGADVPDNADMVTTQKYHDIFEQRTVTRESLERLAHAPVDAEQVNMSSGMTHDKFNVPADDIHARAAALERLKDIHRELGAAAGGQFNYDKAGHVLSFQAGPGDPNRVLQTGWEVQVRDYAGANNLDPADLKKGVMSLAGELSRHEDAYVKLLAAGEGTTPEGQFLLKSIERLRNDLSESVGGANVEQVNELMPTQEQIGTASAERSARLAAKLHEQSQPTGDAGHGRGGNVPRERVHHGGRGGTDHVRPRAPKVPGRVGADVSDASPDEAVGTAKKVVKAARGVVPDAATQQAEGQLAPTEVGRGALRVSGALREMPADVSTAEAAEAVSAHQEALSTAAADPAVESLPSGLRELTKGSLKTLSIDNELTNNPGRLAKVAAEWARDPRMKFNSLDQAVLAETMRDKIAHGRLPLEAIKKLAALPAAEGQIYEIPVEGGGTVTISGGYDAQRAAELVMKLDHPGETVTLSQEQVRAIMANTHAETPSPVELKAAEKTLSQVANEQIASDQYEAVQSPADLARSRQFVEGWTQRGATAAELKKIVDMPSAPAAKLVRVSIGGRTVSITHLENAKQAAKLMLRQMGQGK